MIVKISFCHAAIIVTTLLFSSPLFAYDPADIFFHTSEVKEGIRVNNQSSQKIIVTSPIYLAVEPNQKITGDFIKPCKVPLLSRAEYTTVATLVSADNTPICSIKAYILHIPEHPLYREITSDNEAKCNASFIYYPSNANLILNINVMS